MVLMKNITNQNFGFLTAIKPVENLKTSHPLWLCHCNRCGNDTVVRVYDLCSGNTVSCGCYKKDILHKTNGEGLKLNNGTELYHLTGKKAYSNNKTGYRGVRKDPKSGRYIANITLSKHLYYIGTYDTPEDAYNAYLAAKEQLHYKVLSDPSNPIPIMPNKSHKCSKIRKCVPEKDIERYCKSRKLYRGIFYNKNLCRFTVRKKGVYLGCYTSLDEAKSAYDRGGPDSF
jgi:hypothetical protein